MPSESSPSLPCLVLILGGGIHGAAVARELVLNGVSVVLADTGDLAAGATSKSSRLIHGGLRYLEYGDVGLVRESLIERGLLLKLAPQFVRPLRLFVPTRHRWSGLLRSVLGFFKLARTRFGRRLMGRTERRAPRGFWPIRFGLWMYDLFSWVDGLPRSRGGKITGRAANTPANYPDISRSYRWMCAYSDAQMLYPERCVIALLRDAEQTAREQGISFQVLTHAKIRWQADAFEISQHEASPLPPWQPTLVVNCSGAWGDLTLKEIDAATIPLFAGTKGSHLVTRHPGLKNALGTHGVYAETGDRRLAFVLPFGDAVLVGTTDERWSGDPAQAVATDDELQYLINVVDVVFGLKLTMADVESHYSGVRPLPRTNDTSNAAISRDHSLSQHRLHGVPLMTLVGGKLTTFRSVAQQIADRVLQTLQRPRTASTNERVLIGGENFPHDPATWPGLWQQWAGAYGTTIDEIATLWPLYGMQTKTILEQVATTPRHPIAGTSFSRRTVCWVIEHEWVGTRCANISANMDVNVGSPPVAHGFEQNPLDDLIERRLMLLFAPDLSLATLHDLAECLVETGRLSRAEMPGAIEATRTRLRNHYGRMVK